MDSDMAKKEEKLALDLEKPFRSNSIGWYQIDYEGSWVYFGFLVI